GFFAVEDPSGARMYTRDGTFTRSADGQLITAGGLRVAGDIVFPDDTQNVRISPDGTVSVTLAGGDGMSEVVLGELELVTVDNPNTLRSLGNNLYAATAESGEPRRWEAGIDGRVAQGMVETSNVDVATELIELIEAQRAYELNSKVVQATDEALQVASGLKR
ncbi:MAG: flagellar hook-basal body complex protein, partial [Myxococcales bacterium]|nr:flagellar hook-basal body complex protein [Myxococcales bacterium]